MGKRIKSTFERGLFKEEINKALYKSKEIKEVLLGETSGMSANKVQEEFKKHVKSHLFIDDTITDTDSFIFYDVIFPSLHSNTKTCKVIMYIISHVDIIDNYYKEGYYGNRADILSQMVENVLINDEKVNRSFGIGELTLDSVNVYNSTKFYGCIMEFSVPNFR